MGLANPDQSADAIPNPELELKKRYLVKEFSRDHC